MSIQCDVMQQLCVCVLTAADGQDSSFRLSPHINYCGSESDVKQYQTSELKITKNLTVVQYLEQCVLQ